MHMHTFKIELKIHPKCIRCKQFALIKASLTFSNDTM